MSRYNSDKYSEDNHRGASLIQGLTTEQIRKKANANSSEYENIKEDDLIKDIKDFKTTETDMMWGHLANKDKLVSEEQIKPFVKPDRRDTSDSPKKYSDKRDESDDLKDLINKNNGGSYGSKNDHHTQPSTYAPSYGSHRDDDSYRDKRSSEKDHSEEDEQLKKLTMLRQLGELNQNGVKLSQNYSMNSDYKSMKFEYDLHRGIRDKHNGVRWLNNTILNACWGMELANEKFNPFDFSMDGWSKQIEADTENGDYYDVFGELYEKYVKSGKPVPPEIKLMLMLTGSAIKFGITKGTLNAIPSTAETLDKNPDLRERLRQNAQLDKESMGGTSRRVSGFNQELIKQQELARKNAEDLEMLRQQKREVMMMQQNMTPSVDPEMQNYITQNEIIRKNQQMEIGQLQRQLNMMRSDSRSMYSTRTGGTEGVDMSSIGNQQTMKPPVLPNRMRNRQTGLNYNIDNNNQDIFRQRQISGQKKMMKEQDKFRTQMMQNRTFDVSGKIDESSEDRSINYNSNFNQIIDDALKETVSIGSDTSITMSDNSKTSKRGRKKKQNIKINT